MKQLGVVFRFEFLNYVKRRSFALLTVVLVVAIALVLCWPRIQEATGAKEAENDAEGAAAPTMKVALVDESPSATAQQTAAEFFNAAAEGRGTTFEQLTSDDDVEKLVENETYDAAVVITDPLRYTRFVRDKGLYDSFDEQFSQTLKLRYELDALGDAGLPPDEVATILTAQVESETVLTASGKDQSDNYFYTYVLIMLLYFAVIMYGQFVATSVATEKSTRAMELLITTTKPTYLMFGKVFGAGLAGLLQLVLILGSGYLFYNMNASYYADNAIVQSIFNMPLSILLFCLLFFVLGFFIYAFVFAALASLVSRMEDLSTAILPATYMFIIAFMVVIFSISSGSVDNPVMVFCSFFPLTSPMAMFARIAMSTVPSWQIIVSVVVLIASTLGIGMLAASIYRLGVLLYGNRPKLSEIARLLRASKS